MSDVLVKITKCPPGMAYGADDLHRWAVMRGGHSLHRCDTPLDRYPIKWKKRCPRHRRRRFNSKPLEN